MPGVTSDGGVDVVVSSLWENIPAWEAWSKSDAGRQQHIPTGAPRARQDTVNASTLRQQHLHLHSSRVCCGACIISGLLLTSTRSLGSPGHPDY